MPETRKVLGQLNPLASALTAIYTVPTATQAIVSSIVVANKGASDATFRVSVSIAAAADNDKQYLFYNLPIPANDTFIATLGITLGAGDVVKGYASTTSLAFNVFGVEIT